MAWQSWPLTHTAACSWDTLSSLSPTATRSVRGFRLLFLVSLSTSHTPPAPQPNTTTSCSSCHTSPHWFLTVARSRRCQQQHLRPAITITITTGISTKKRSTLDSVMARPASCHTLHSIPSVKPHTTLHHIALAILTTPKRLLPRLLSSGLTPQPQ